jgi:hypothetical protein
MLRTSSPYHALTSSSLTSSSRHHSEFPKSQKPHRQTNGPTNRSTGLPTAVDMDPIDVRADTTFTQALRCVEYRLPSSTGYQPPGYVLALGVRYGLVGMAASHHLLITADDYEESGVMRMMDAWPNLVEDHVRWDMIQRLPFAGNSNVPHVIGRISALPLSAYVPLYRRICPLANALDLVCDAIIEENKAMIYEGWSWFRRKSAVKLFTATLRESSAFALNFFERRQADLDEVPEIALIGE